MREVLEVEEELLFHLNVVEVRLQTVQSVQEVRVELVSKLQSQNLLLRCRGLSVDSDLHI